MPEKLKPVLLFALQTTIESPVYDKQGRMLGRTFALPKSNKQFFALPDAPDAREHAVDSIMAHINPACPPRQVLMGKDDDGVYHPMDLSLFDFVAKIQAAPIDADAASGVAFPTRAAFEEAARDYVRGSEESEAANTKPAQPAAEQAAAVHSLLKENGRMTALQIASALDLAPAVVTRMCATKKKSFKLDSKKFYTAIGKPI